MTSLPRTLAPVVALAAIALGCRERAACERCDTLVIAATGEPTALLPPLVQETVGRDVGDFVYERLAVLRPGAAPVDSSGFDPGLAARWRRIDSLTWRFELRPNARWQDGTPVTPEDVRFSFEAYADTALGAPAGVQLAGVTVEADGPAAVRIRFPRPGPEQLYDATWPVRILPRHRLDSIPRARWGADSSVAQVVGSGPYRLTQWQRGQFLRLERIDSTGGGIRNLVWRFTEDQDAALNLVLAGEADVVETLTSAAARDRAGRDSAVRLVPYPAAVAGFLGFRHADRAGRPHPILADRTVRRALTLALDRPTLVSAILGDARVPPGPISRAVWIWDDSVRTLGYDRAAAERLLDSAGWMRGPTGARARQGRPLAIDILIPSTSGLRKQLAEAIQQQWKAAGVVASITAVDFPVFQQRLGQGRFDAMIGAYLDEPSPRSLADQWTRDGFDGLNQGRYDNPGFDALLARASRTADPALARRLWREALDTLNADPPAIFLYTPTNVAAISTRVDGVTIDPFSWLAAAATWRLTSARSR
jgi:peptide/nickel transport system substrate-binding protein